VFDALRLSIEVLLEVLTDVTADVTAEAITGQEEDQVGD
jgi:hypothetical protein